MPRRRNRPRRNRFDPAAQHNKIPNNNGLPNVPISIYNHNHNYNRRHCISKTTQPPRLTITTTTAATAATATTTITTTTTTTTAAAATETKAAEVRVDIHYAGSRHYRIWLPGVGAGAKPQEARIECLGWEEEGEKMVWEHCCPRVLCRRCGGEAEGEGKKEAAAAVAVAVAAAVDVAEGVVMEGVEASHGVIATEIQSQPQPQPQPGPSRQMVIGGVSPGRLETILEQQEEAAGDLGLMQWRELGDVREVARTAEMEWRSD